MTPLDKAVIVLSCLIALSILCFVVKWVNAEEPILDKSGCDMTETNRHNTWDQGYGGHYADCYAPAIYKQNQHIIEQNDHTMRLIALDMCSQWHTTIWVNHYGETVEHCQSRVINDTK